VSAPEHVRHEWEESARQLEASAGDRDRYRALLDQVDTVTTELRKRVGQTYSLAELARAYEDAERWAAATLAETDAPAWWPRTLAAVVGSAFHAYARGALDYEP
jgi:ABC-type transporter Mla subunit MlaD